MQHTEKFDSSFKLQILSDIHLEFGRAGFDFPQTGNCLALVGDIGDPASSVYESFLLEQAARFDKVFVLAGNHGFYCHTPEESINHIKQVCNQIPAKLIFLNQTTYDMGEDYTVLGCTLWSEVLDYELSNVSLYPADYRHIQGWTIWQNNHQHSIKRAWLQKELKKVEAMEKLAVVLTHHAPSVRKTSAPEHRSSDISSAFATDLEQLLKLPVVLWAFGHTHFSSDQLFNGACGLVSNQVGYPHEADVGYKAGFHVDLD